ncbi:MAG: hypothetical protein J0649_06510 [Methylococcales bacterium]|nr:hypothetical protein [Methylococcales bacterium]
MCKHFIFFIVASFLITGCAPKNQLVKDVTPDQLGKDNGECKLEAQKATQFDLSGSALVQQIRQNEALENCLQAKGYVWQQESNEQQNDIKNRYTQAVTKWKINLEPIQEYIINICRPQEDKDYVKCINEKNEEIIAASFFPDLEIKLSNALKESKNQFLRKEITRKEFRDVVSQLEREHWNKMKERMNNDIKAGVYTGKY